MLKAVALNEIFGDFSPAGEKQLDSIGNNISKNVHPTNPLTLRARGLYLIALPTRG